MILFFSLRTKQKKIGYELTHNGFITPKRNNFLREAADNYWNVLWKFLFLEVANSWPVD